MSLAVKVCQEQALRAYYNMLSLFDRGHLDIKINFHSLTKWFYGAEVWGSTPLRKEGGKLKACQDMK